MFREEKGKNLVETRKANRVLIKNAIYRDPNANRTSIAGKLGLTLATLSTAASEMIRNGVLEEVKGNEKAGVLGRKAAVLQFRPDAAYAIGIDLSFSVTRGILVDMKGNVLKQMRVEDNKATYEESLQKMISLITQLIPKKKSRLVGIGICAPGYADIEKGVLRQPAFENWGKDIPIGDDVSRHFNLPVILGNGLYMSCYGYDMELRNNVPPMYVYFYSYRRIACKVVVNGDMMSGLTEAGEIGHNPFFVSGEWKRFNAVATENRLFEDMRAAVERGELPTLKAEMDKGVPIFVSAMKLYENGDPYVTPYIDRVMKLNAVCASQMLNVLNPGTIVCDSHLFLSKKSREMFEKYVKICVYSPEQKEIRFIYKEHDEYNGAKGAALRTLKKQFLDV